MEAVLRPQAADRARRVQPRAESLRLDRGAGRRARHPRCRSGSRRSSRCVSSRPPARRCRPRRATPCSALPTRRTPRPRDRRVRSPRRRGRTCSPAASWKVSPRCSANSPGVGRRSTALGVTTTGVSRARTPMLASSTSTSSASSRSIQTCAKLGATGEGAQRHRVAREPRTDDLDRAGTLTRPQELRAGAIRARKMMSASSAFALMSRRNSGGRIREHPPRVATPEPRGTAVARSAGSARRGTCRRRGR